jgi:hypothetical protein
MTNLETLASNYNYYPRTMISFCSISYNSLSSIPGEVKKLGWDVVWGPAELVSSLDVSYSLAYICRRQQLNVAPEYTVVIRGTNMMSWDSWVKEDFAIGTTRPFRELARRAPANALISHGTFRGTQDLLKLRDPNKKTGIVDFLSNQKPSYLYVTGHSLGGTLSPALFAYLNDVLYGGGFVTGMALWTFAGLTAGDVNFNTYFNSLFNPLFPWRLHNTMDIAPFCWWSLDNIKNIYKSNGLNWGFPEDDLLEDLFDRAKGKNYAQPVGNQVLPGAFNQSIIDKYLWTAQAMYQHHSTTYQKLVNQVYPEALASSA